MAAESDNLVSVIVPTYKRHDYLALTLESILSQTHENLEVLVVSDGDDEATAAVVSDLNDDRLQYLFIEHSGRPAVPRNEGLRKATGNLLAFCDDDDIWLSRKLEAQVTVIADGYQMCNTDYSYIDADGHQLDQQNYYDKYFGPIDWQTFFQSMGFICNASVVFSRRAFKKVGFLNESVDLRAYEDFEYWMRMLYQNKGFFINRKLVAYRVHQGSIQRDDPRRVLEQRLTLHRSLRKTIAIPPLDYYRKYAKLMCHYGFDRWPKLKSFIRTVQGRPGAN